uniref:Uncharacterized protein n=2 Tax=Spongospora subterranea TaxID=70186 RepID=A0A0H5R3J9_9EUKA|eukprot:CRZ02589.1 hypothetical protein [Spongospora subterranea]
MCAKPLRKASIQSRIEHLVVCTRIPKAAIESMFLGDGSGQPEEPGPRPVHERSRGLRPEELVQRLETAMATVDRQLISLNLFRQNIQVTLDRALSLLNPNLVPLPLSKNAPPQPPEAEANQRANESQGGAALPAMKTSALGKRFSRSSGNADDDPRQVAVESQPEDAILSCLNPADDTDERLPDQFDAFVGCFTQISDD